jgi:hypothetical protein
MIVCNGMRAVYSKAVDATAQEAVNMMPHYALALEGETVWSGAILSGFYVAHFRRARLLSGSIAKKISGTGI